MYVYHGMNIYVVLVSLLDTGTWYSSGTSYQVRSYVVLVELRYDLSTHVCATYGIPKMYKNVDC